MPKLRSRIIPAVRARAAGTMGARQRFSDIGKDLPGLGLLGRPTGAGPEIAIGTQVTEYLVGGILSPGCQFVKRRVGLKGTRASSSFWAKIDRAISRALIGASKIPFRKCPVLTQQLRSGSKGPMYGQPSGVAGRSPAHAR